MTTTATRRPARARRASAAPRPATASATPAAVWRRVPTPMGPFVVGIDRRGCLLAGWQRSDWPGVSVDDAPRRRHPLLDGPRGLVARLQRWFEGGADRFDDLPLPAGTEFQRACWRSAKRVAPGETISYAELARRAGSPGAARAAGQAMRRNPTPVLVPCHRVVGSGGALHGFGGSSDPDGRELALKAWLLEMEARGAQRGRRRS